MIKGGKALYLFGWRIGNDTCFIPQDSLAADADRFSNLLQRHLMRQTLSSQIFFQSHSEVLPSLITFKFYHIVNLYATSRNNFRDEPLPLRISLGKGGG